MTPTSPQAGTLAGGVQEPAVGAAGARQIQAGQLLATGRVDDRWLLGTQLVRSVGRTGSKRPPGIEPAGPGTCAAWHMRGHKVEVIEVDRFNLPIAGTRRLTRRAATTVHITASPLSPLVQSAWIPSASVTGPRNWMLALARHYAHFRSAYPTERLLVVFEIDGPIVDQRHMVRHRLLDYDRVHGTDHFRGVEAADIDADGGDLARLLISRDLRRWSAATSSIGTRSNLRRWGNRPARSARIQACSSFTPRRYQQSVSRWGQAMGTRLGYVAGTKPPSNLRSHSIVCALVAQPAVDADVVDLDAAFGQQLLHVSVGETEAQIPPDGQHYHRGREPDPENADS